MLDVKHCVKRASVHARFMERSCSEGREFHTAGEVCVVRIPLAPVSPYLHFAMLEFVLRAETQRSSKGS
jgi:hypothetical protein